MTDLSKILSIAGRSGLHKHVGQSKASVIVESLETGKRFPVFGSQQVSSLDEISVYTYDGDMPLLDVFKRIHDNENGGEVSEISKEPAALRAYFSKVLEEFDEERVYISDIKKILRWYNDLLRHDWFDFKEEDDKETEREDKGDKE